MQIPVITDSAKQHINKICKEHKAYAVSLELKGGGCAGYEYCWSAKQQSEISDSDVVIETGEGKLAISSVSIAFLENTEIDYITEMLGSKLIVKNPNVQTACGCGESIGF